MEVAQMRSGHWAASLVLLLYASTNTGPLVERGQKITFHYKFSLPVVLFALLSIYSTKHTRLKTEISKTKAKKQSGGQGFWGDVSVSKLPTQNKGLRWILNST